MPETNISATTLNPPLRKKKPNMRNNNTNAILLHPPLRLCASASLR